MNKKLAVISVRKKAFFINPESGEKSKDVCPMNESLQETIDGSSDV